MDTKKIISALAAGIILILGIWYLQKNSEAPAPDFEPQGQQAQSGSTSTQSAYFLKFPTATTSRAEKEKYFLEVANASKIVDTIKIQERCTPDTLIVRARLGKELTIVNTDTVPHTISVSNEYSWPIEPGKSIVIPADFGTGEGTYTYSCENSGGPIGIILIAAPNPA